MTYALGIDLGTTYTAAAVARNGRAEVAALGYRATSVPSVVLLTEDGRFLVGDAAERRAASEPHRVAREFKRRVGDSTPLLLGGTPIAVDRCLAEILRWVATTVGETEGGPPGSVTVTHPANWGEFKQDVLQEALRLADLPGSRLLAEPVAAATWYAGSERLQAGHVVAVYDLGGGTFDAAILRQGTDGGFENLGRAEGIERLGGIDIDQAVLGFVLRALGDDGTRLASEDGDDPAAVAALAQLRRACVDAKEALSSETSVTIPVWLPGLHHEVLMRRTELEELVTPLLQPTIDALGRVVRSTGLRTADIHSVLLVGGSSRIPLIARQVSAGFGRPIAVDAHPKHPVALGAALDALHHLPSSPPTPVGGAGVGVGGGAVGGAGAGPGVVAGAGIAGGAGAGAGAGAADWRAAGVEPWFSGPTPGFPPSPTTGGPPRPIAPPPPPASRYGHQNDGRRLLVGAGVTAMFVLIAILAFVLTRPNDDTPNVDTASESTQGEPGDSPGTASELGGEPGSEPETFADVDTLADASPALEAFAGINDGAAVRVVDLTIHADFVTINVQKTDAPGYADEYQWDGALTGPEPMFIPPEPEEIEATLFDLTEIDPAVIPGLTQDALNHCTWSDAYVTHVIIDRFEFDEDRQVLIRVYVGQEPDYGESGYVAYTLDGTLFENNCE